VPVVITARQGCGISRGRVAVFNEHDPATAEFLRSRGKGRKGYMISDKRYPRRNARRS